MNGMKHAMWPSKPWKTFWWRHQCWSCLTLTNILRSILMLPTLWAKEYTPTPSSIVFTLGYTFESIKEFGGALMNVIRILHLLINMCVKCVFNARHQCMKHTNHEWTNFAQFPILSHEMLNLWWNIWFWLHMMTMNFLSSSSLFLF